MTTLLKKELNLDLVLVSACAPPCRAPLTSSRALYRVTKNVANMLWTIMHTTIWQIENWPLLYVACLRWNQYQWFIVYTKTIYDRHVTIIPLLRGVPQSWVPTAESQVPPEHSPQTQSGHVKQTVKVLAYSNTATYHTPRTPGGTRDALYSTWSLHTVNSNINSQCVEHDNSPLKEFGSSDYYIKHVCSSHPRLGLRGKEMVRNEEPQLPLLLERATQHLLDFQPLPCNGGIQLSLKHQEVHVGLRLRYKIPHLRTRCVCIIIQNGYTVVHVYIFVSGTSSCIGVYEHIWS